MRTCLYICVAALTLAQTGCVWVPGGESRSGGDSGYYGGDRHEGHPDNGWNYDHHSSDRGQMYTPNRTGDSRERDYSPRNGWTQ